MSPKVTIIILNYNGWKDTIECLESVFRIQYSNYNVVVVDNFSSDNSVNKIKEWADGNLKVISSDNEIIYNLVNPPILKPIELETVSENDLKNNFLKLKIICSEFNNGFSSGNNIGIRHALQDLDCKYVWLLNNDTVVSRNSLNFLIEKAEDNPKTALLGSKLLFYSSPEIIQGIAARINKNTGVSYHLFEGLPAETSFSDQEQFDYIIGASMLARRTFIEEVGLLCEDYFLYNEEPDWCLRAINNGWNFGVAQQSIVYHKQAATTGNIPKSKSEKIDLIGLKSRLIFMKKFYPEKMFLVYLSFLGIILNRIKRKQIKRIPKITLLVFKSIINSL